MNNKNTNNNNSYLVEKVAIDLITMIPRFEANCLAYFKVLETQLTVIQNVYEFIIYILMKRYFVFVLCPKRNFGGGGGGGHIVNVLSALLRVQCISPIFFEVEIPNLVCVNAS